ncbi:hypothetical protein FRB90_011960 [Tulasnella sp. 427]|nr:hypothetical protein FRB90_011960 [Tulasnella sp. 427]
MVGSPASVTPTTSPSSPSFFSSLMDVDSTEQQLTPIERCERAVSAWQATGGEEHIARLVQGVTNKDFTLLNIIKALGPALTAEEGDHRSRGVELLSAVLERCPPERLDKHSTHVLLTFYEQKLDDSDTVIPALHGLLSLVSLPTFTASDATTLFQSLVQHVNMKAHVQSTRYIVFRILDTLVAKYREGKRIIFHRICIRLMSEVVLKGLEDEFLRKYVSLVEGEKDPRNLLLAFSIDRVVLIEWEVKSYIEDFFDVTFCYFPITFKPPPNDSYKISTDDLKTALRACLSASPFFGTLAVPIFMEKLAATTASVKQDVLQTMSICLPVYGSAVARNFGSTIWDAVKIEIFQPIDAETEKAALEATSALVRTLPSADDNSPAPLVSSIVSECIEILKEPEKNKAQHAVKVLSALLRTTAGIRSLVVGQSIPHLIKLYLDPAEASQRSHIVLQLSNLLLTLQEVYSGDIASASYVQEHVLEAHKDELLGVISSSVKVADTRMAALSGTSHLVQIQGLLTEEELGYLVQHINELLEPSSDLQDLKNVLLNLLTTISKTNAPLVERTTLPLLFGNLPDSAPAADAKVERASYQRTLKCLSTLCLQQALFETLVIRLSTKLELVCSEFPRLAEGKENHEVTTLREHNAAYAHSLLLTLEDALDFKIDSKLDADIPKYIDRLVPRLYALCTEGATSPKPSLALANDVRLIEAASGVILRIVRCNTSARQSQFLAGLITAFQTGNFGPLTNGQNSGTESVIPPPLQLNSSELSRNLVILLAPPIISLRKDVQLPVDDSPKFLQDLLNWGIADNVTLPQSTAGFQIASTILNKHLENLAVFVETSLPTFWAAAVSPTADVSKRKGGIEAWTWTTKALLVRNDKRAENFVEDIFGLLGDESVGWDAARAIGMLAKDEETLSKSNYAVVKLFHVQKYAAKVLPLILAGCKDASEPTRRTAYLAALTTLVKYLPQSMYMHEITTLMPLFILGLDLPEVEMRANVIEALVTLASETDASQEGPLAEHVSTVISALIKNALPAEMTSSRLRVAALKCLAILPQSVSYERLHPYKSNVLRQLGKALDDRNRGVRKVAVDAREAWFITKA